jgi:hypothetical protein
VALGEKAMATYREIESVIFTEARFYGGLSELDSEDALDLIKDAAEQCGAYNEDTDEVTYSENFEGRRHIFKMPLDDFACFFLG